MIQSQAPTKAVFPVIETGSDFFPASKAIPKEMFPILGKPLIQYAVEEAVESGITELIFVINKNKQAVIEHFSQYQPPSRLQGGLKNRSSKQKDSILPSNIKCIYIDQGEPLGLGHAILCAKSLIGDQPFAVLLPDDLLDSNVTAKLIRRYQVTNSSVLAIEEIPYEYANRYSVIEPKPAEGSKLHKVNNIVDKPIPENAPSQLGVIGRYIFTHGIFSYLERLEETKNLAEIELTDIVTHLLSTEESVYAYTFSGRRYDCGMKLGYVQANIDYALADPTIDTQLLAHIKYCLQIME